MSADAVAVNGAGSGSQNLLASARSAEFVRPVGVPGRDGLGRMELFYDGERYFAKDSRGTQYPLSYGVSEDEAVQQIRNTLGGSGYAHASGRSSGATGALSAARPSAAQNRAEAAASSETAALANAVTAQRTATHPNHGSEHVSALKNALAGYASGRLSGTDLRIALRAASQALGDPKALGTESRRYLEDFYRQGEPKLQTADAQAQAKAQAAAQARRQAAEAGDAAVKTLGNAIGQFDRSGRSGPARSELNAALAGARAADKTGWSPATRAQFQKWDQQASQRLWSAPAKAAAAKPATPGTTTSAPSLEFFGAPQGTAVYDAGSGLEIGRVLIGRSGLGWQIQFDNRGQGAAKTHNLDFDALWKDKHGAEFPKTRQDVARWVFKAFGNQSQFTRADLYPAYGHQRSVFDPQQTRNNLAGMDDLAQAATRSAQRPSSPLGSAEKPFTVATPEAPRISQSTKENIDGLAYASALGLAVRDFRQGRINGEQLRQMVSAAQTRYDAYQSRYTDPRIKANHLAYFEQAQRALQDEAALGSKLLFKGDSAKGIVALDKAVADYRAHPSHENWMKLQNSQSAAGQGSLKDAWSPKTREAFATLQQQASQLLRERKLTQQGMAAIDRDGQRLQIALWQEQKVQGGRWVTSGYVAQGPFVSDLRTGQLLPNQSKPEQQTMLHDAQGRNVMTRQAAHASAMKLNNSGRLSGWNPTPDQVSMAKVKADMARQQIKPVSGSMAVRFEVAAADRAFKASGTNALNSSAFDAKAFSYAVVNNPVINQAAQQVQNFAPNPVTRALLDFSRSDLRAEQRRLTAQSEYVPDGGLLVKGAGVAGSLVGGLPLSLPPNIPTLGGYGATAYVQREILENPGINIAGAYATQQALGLVPNGKYLATTVLKQGGAQLLGDLSSQTFFGTTAKSPEELITGAITTSAISGVTGSRAKLDAGPQINRGQRLQRGVTAPDEAMRELRGGKRSDKQVDVLPAIPRLSLDVSQSPRSTISVTDTTPNKPPYSALPDTRSRPTLAAKPTITRAQSLLVTQRPSPEPTRVEVPPPGKPAASRQTSRSDILPPMRRVEADRVGALNVAAFVDEQNLKPDAINQKSLVGEWQKAEVKEVRIDPNTGAIVALAFGHISSNNSALGVLDRVAVAPAYRQHGIARGLIESVETGLANRGATKVKIQAAADSATPEAYLKGYYESLGYVQMANGFLEKPLQSPARGSPQQPRNGDAAPPSQTTPSAQQPIKPRAVASPLEPGLLIEIATSTGVSEGWLAGPTAVRQTNSGPVYRATRTFERDVSWEAIQALQKTQPNTTIKGLNPNNAWSSQASRDVRIELPQASGSGTVLWQVRGPSADGRGLSLVREEIKHFKLQADGRATEVTALGATPGSGTQEWQRDAFVRAQEAGLGPSDPRGPPDRDGVNYVNNEPPSEPRNEPGGSAGGERRLARDAVASLQHFQTLVQTFEREPLQFNAAQLRRAQDSAYQGFVTQVLSPEEATAFADAVRRADSVRARQLQDPQQPGTPAAAIDPGRATADSPPSDPNVTPEAPIRPTVAAPLAIRLSAPLEKTSRVAGSLAENTWLTLHSLLKNPLTNETVVRASNFDPWRRVDQALAKALQAPKDVVANVRYSARQDKYPRQAKFEDREYEKTIQIRDKVAKRWNDFDSKLAREYLRLTHLQTQVNTVQEQLQGAVTVAQRRALEFQLRGLVAQAAKIDPKAGGAANTLADLGGKYAGQAGKLLTSLTQTRDFRAQQLAALNNQYKGVESAAVRAAQTALSKAEEALKSAELLTNDPFRDSMAEAFHGSDVGSAGKIRSMTDLNEQLSAFKELQSQANAVSRNRPTFQRFKQSRLNEPSPPSDYVQALRDDLNTLRANVAGYSQQVGEAITELHAGRERNAGRSKAHFAAVAAGDSELAREVGQMGGLRSDSKSIAGKAIKGATNSGPLRKAESRARADAQALAQARLGPDWEQQLETDSVAMQALDTLAGSGAADPQAHARQLIKALDATGQRLGRQPVLAPSQVLQLKKALLKSASVLDLEQRASAPLPIEKQLAVLQHKVDRSAAILQAATIKADQIDRRLAGDRAIVQSRLEFHEAAEREQSGAGQPVTQSTLRGKRLAAADLTALQKQSDTNQRVLEQIRTIHTTHILKRDSVRAALERATQLQGATPGKVLRSVVGLGNNLHKAALVHTLVGVPFGWTQVLTGQKGAEKAAAVLNVPKPANSIGTFGFVLETPYNNIYAVAQGPGTRGPFATLLPQIFLGAPAGTATPTAFKGSKGQTQIVATSDRLQLGGAAIGSSFHPFGKNAFSLQNAVELRLASLGFALRSNPLADFPRGGSRAGVELMGNAPAPLTGLPSWLPGIQWQSTSRLGVGRVTFGADFAGRSAGRNTTRDVPGAWRIDAKNPSINSAETTFGRLNFGTTTTASELGRNYEYDAARAKAGLNNPAERLASALSEPIALGFDVVSKAGELPGLLGGGIRSVLFKPQGSDEVPQQPTPPDVKSAPPSASQLPADDAPASGVPPPRSRTMSADGVPPQQATAQLVDRPALLMPSSDGKRALAGLPPVDAGKGFIMAVDFSGSTPKVGAMYANDSTVKGQAPPLLIRAETRHGGHATVIDALFRQSIEQPGGTARIVGAHAVPLADGSLQMKFRSHSINLYEKSIRYGDERAEKTIADRFTYGRQATPDVARLTAQAVADATGQTVRYGEPGPNDTAGAEIVLAPRRAGRLLSSGELVPSGSAVTGITQLTRRSVVELQELNATPAGPAAEPLGQPTGFRYFEVAFLDAKGVQRQDGRIPVIDFGYGKNLVTLIEGDALSTRPVPQSRSLHGYAAAFRASIGPAIVVQAHGRTQGLQLGAGGSATRGAAGPTLTPQQLTSMVEAIDKNGTRPVCLNSCLTGAEGESFAKAFSALNPQRVVYAPHARVDVLEATFGDLSRFNRFENGRLLGPARPDASTEPPTAPSGQSQPATPTVSSAALNKTETDVARMLASGASFAEISSQLFLTPKTLYPMVDAAVKRLGVDARPAAAALIAATHQLGLIEADPTILTRAHAVLRIHADVGKEISLQDRRTTVTFDVLEGWLDGKSRNELQSKFNLNADQMQAIVQAWRGRLGLEKVSGRHGNYEAEVAQIVQRVTQRGYYAPVEPGKPVLEGSSGAAIGQPVRALEPATLPRRVELAATQLNTIRLLASGLSYTQISAVTRRSTDQLHKDVGSALREGFGIAPPAGAADAIVAAHRTGLVKAEASTLQRAEATIAEREGRSKAS